MTHKRSHFARAFPDLPRTALGAEIEATGRCYVIGSTEPQRCFRRGGNALGTAARDRRRADLEE
jgi:hypothetical protein